MLVRSSETQALDDLGLVGVEDVAVGVQVAEQLRQLQPQIVDVLRVRAVIGLVLVARREVAVHAQPGAGQRDLADLEQQEGHGLPTRRLRRDDPQAVQERGDRRRDVVREADRLGLDGDQRLEGREARELLGAAVVAHVPAHVAVLLPTNARPRVTSSAYSRSPPTGSPLAEPGHACSPTGSEHAREVRRGGLALEVRVRSRRISSVTAPSASRASSSRMRRCVRADAVDRARSRRRGRGSAPGTRGCARWRRRPSCSSTTHGMPTVRSRRGSRQMPALVVLLCHVAADRCRT